MPETGGSSDEETQQVPLELNTNVAQSARVYDYWLGGKDNFPADQAVAEAIAEQVPTIRAQVREQRAFLGRTVRYLVGEAGIRQFLDIGTGIPSAGNVHNVAQELAPESRVLYVDNDPIVLAHARALRPGTPQGRVAYIQADLRQPETILGDPAVARTLDLARPVGLVLIGIMHHLRDEDDPRGSWRPWWVRWRRAATWCCRRRPRTSTRRRCVAWRRCRSRGGSPTCRAPWLTPNRSSRAWRWSSRAWCRSWPGGPTPGCPSGIRTASTSTAGSPASPEGAAESGRTSPPFTPARATSRRLLSGIGRRWRGNAAHRSPTAASWPASGRLQAPREPPRCSRQTCGHPSERPFVGRPGSDC